MSKTVSVTSRRTLAIVFGVFIAGSLYRAIHFYETGFFVSDEFSYAYHHLGNIAYQGRYFFNLFNWAWFRFFGIDSADKIALFMPVYFLFWSAIGLGSAYKTMKLFKHEDSAITKTLLLSLTLPVFVLFSVSILTEPVAFGLTMLGIYLSVWFWKKGITPVRYLAPFIASLCFVAASYTRADFIIFQTLGFVPFVIAEWKKNKAVIQAFTVLLLFILPATFFMVYPSDSGTSTTVAIQVAVQGSSPSTTNVTLPTPPLGVAPISTSTGGFNPVNMIWLFSRGIIIGWNPVLVILMAGGFAVTLWKKDLLTFWLALLALGTFAGTVFTFSSVTTYPISTNIRYAYDALPAYFLLAPAALTKVNTKKLYAAIILGLTVSGGIALPWYQDALQSNLWVNYPFLQGHQAFLGLDYRAPYAQMRDYFHGLPAQHFVVVGESTSYLNMTYNWKFTPGVSDIEVTFYPYSQLKLNNLSDFYLYVEPQNSGLEVPAEWTYSVIYDTPSFYFAHVSIPLPGKRI